MATVKVLVSGTDTLLNLVDKGDVVEVVPSVSDWGTKTVTPEWIRLTITDTPGGQQAAEDALREYLVGWGDQFSYTEVSGAGAGEQRYRVEVDLALANDFDIETKKEIRDDILVRFDGVKTSQSATYFEFDSYPEIPLDEIEQVVRDTVHSFRRFRFPEALVDAALASVNPGEPAEFSRTWAWTKDNIEDKLVQ